MTDTHHNESHAIESKNAPNEDEHIGASTTDFEEGEGHNIGFMKKFS